MHENVNFQKNVKIILEILFFKNLKNATYDALLQSFVNEIKS